MSCYHPVKGYRAERPGPSGRRQIVFSPRKGFVDLPMEVPCGSCIGCRLDRAKEWAVRCVHEASLHKESCFLTLTYADENLPDGGSLNPRNFVLFMKRLRKKFGRVRFFQCGEYGAALGRPHHHCIIFGWRPTDLSLWKRKGNVKLFRSKAIEELWPHGFVTVGDVSYESAAYIARYILKKVGGPGAEDHYQGKHPEYITMSRRPGIGKNWIDKFSDEVYKKDTLVYGLGRLTKPPRYYDKQLEQRDPEMLREIVNERNRRDASSDYRSEYRLKSREKLSEARIKMLEREIH